ERMISMHQEGIFISSI
uniref:Uncharacterized protein n=1 Tax=Amphimedon queenslandica TaxID=400682 RepID=A0A1X7T7F6_AMPQE